MRRWRRSSSPASADHCSAAWTSSANAPGLVDAITMEDIGKFPDANLANALMRIPGVTMSMTSNATNNGQATTTGQGVSITVRGFGPTYNETLFDGRFIPSANSVTGVTTGGRSFDFSGLSADMVERLEVLKSPDASFSAGAIGASINVTYPKPFDHPGLTIAGSASGAINTDDGAWKPNGNFLISDTFANDKTRRSGCRRLFELPDQPVAGPELGMERPVRRAVPALRLYGTGLRHAGRRRSPQHARHLEAGLVDAGLCGRLEQDQRRAHQPPRRGSVQADGCVGNHGRRQLRPRRPDAIR